MTSPIGGAMSADAAAVYAQHSAQETFGATQEDAKVKVADLRDAKETAREERKALLEKRNALLAEQADEDGGVDECFLWSWAERNQSDVAQDIQRNAIEQQKVSSQIDELQKRLGTELKDQQDCHENYSQAQQGFQEMLQIIEDLRTTASTLE